MIPLAGAAKAFAVLRTCETDQLVEWGADPAQFSPGGTPAKVGDPNNVVPQPLFSRVKFPGGPIKPEHYLVISTAGVVEKCEAVYGIPDSNMEQVVCDYLVGRKVGSLAKDPTGKPVRGVVTVVPGVIRTVIVRD
jgi:hypothetical protein